MESRARAIYRMAMFTVLAVSCLPYARLHAESAGSDYSRGKAAEMREDYDTAFSDYQKACKKNPKDLHYRSALIRVRVTASAMHVTKGRKLLSEGNDEAALTEFLHASEIDPSNESAQQEIGRVRDMRGEAPPPTASDLPEAAGQQQLESLGAPAVLKPVSNEPMTLHLAEDTKVVYQAIGKAAGVNMLFDPDLTSKRIQVDLNNVSLLDALRIVGAVSNTFWRPVTENTIFVATNNPNKRRELDEQAVQTFYLENAWQQNDLTDIQSAVRSVLLNAKVSPVGSQNALVVRGTPDELLVAQKLINDLDKARAEVVVDIAVLEVSKNWERNLGISWPSSAGVALQTSSSTTTTGTTPSTGTTTTNPSFYDLAHLKASNFAVTVGSATANLLLTDSDTKILQNPRLRSTDAQKATMKIGSKIPIATGSFQSGVGATAGVSPLAETQFQYQDVGVNIEMTPTVHYDRDVTLKIKIEVTTQSGSVTISGVTEPILSQRTVEHVIRLHEGEASILGGIEERQDQASWSGIPGLSSIPILKYLFGAKDRTVNDDELVFLVVPHVVRSQSLDRVNLRSIDTGSGQSIELRHLASASTGPAPVVEHPTMDARSTVGTVRGQSAAAAAPAALAQMNEAAQMTGKAATANTGPPSTQSAHVSLTLSPQQGPVAQGATFKVPVVLNGGTDIASVPMQVQYDSAKLSLVNIDQGELLGRDGKPVSLVHRDDGQGVIVLNVSRPPGATGISGTGVVCVLSFEAKAAGDSAIAITRPGAITSNQTQLPVDGGRVTVQVK